MNVEQNAVKTHECAVIAINCLGAEVYEVCLQLPDAAEVSYQPGQYLMLASQSGDFNPYSIASAPAEGNMLRLQILANNAPPMKLLAELQRDRLARVQLPFGDVCVDCTDQRPLLLIAAGTGMAQMHGILEQIRLLGSTTEVHLYWGAREVQDFYWLAAWSKWEKMENVHLHKVVSHDEDWDGRSGLLYEAVSKDMPDLAGCRVVASGSAAMVYGTLDALVEHGMQPEQMQADVFSYAPRED